MMPWFLNKLSKFSLIMFKFVYNMKKKEKSKLTYLYR